MLAEIVTIITSAMATWWNNFNMTPEELWLSQSADVGELENRLRILENSDQSFSNFITGTR